MPDGARACDEAAGTTIAFNSNRTGVMQVWLMHADGSDQHQLTIDPAPKDQVPDWWPDGA